MKFLKALILVPFLGACATMDTLPMGRFADMPNDVANKVTGAIYPGSQQAKSVEEQSVGSHTAYTVLSETPTYVSLRAARSGLMNTGFTLTSFAPLIGVITAVRGSERGVVNIESEDGRGSNITFLVTGSKNDEAAAQAIREIQHYTTEFLIK